MKKAITDNAWQILAIGFFILFLGKGCTSSRIDDLNNTQTKKIDSLTARISSLEKNAATEKEIDSIFDIKLWKFLELEELSDKNNIPINKLKYQNKQ